MNHFRLLNAAGIPLLAAILLLTITFHSMTSSAEAAQAYSMEVVKSAQQALAEKGFNPGPADGLWGPKTTKAVMSFQENEGIPSTGNLDDVTQKLLLGSGSSATAVAPSAHSSPPIMSVSSNTGQDVPGSEIVWGRHK